MGWLGWLGLSFIVWGLVNLLFLALVFYCGRPSRPREADRMREKFGPWIDETLQEDQ
jgi:hypothetical protein